MDKEIDKQIYKDANLPQKPEDILEQLRTMISLSNEYIESKRQTIMDRWQIYKKLDTLKIDEVKGNMAYYIIDAYLSLETSDKLSVTFRSVDQKPIARDRALFLTNNAKNDYAVGQ